MTRILSEIFKAIFWACAGAVAITLWWAFPLAKPNDDMLAIASLRELGCEPFVDGHRALHSGCESVKKIEVRP